MPRLMWSSSTRLMKRATWSPTVKCLLMFMFVNYYVIWYYGFQCLCLLVFTVYIQVYLGECSCFHFFLSSGEFPESVKINETVDFVGGKSHIVIFTYLIVNMSHNVISCRRPRRWHWVRWCWLWGLRLWRGRRHRRNLVIFISCLDVTDLIWMNKFWIR